MCKVPVPTSSKSACTRFGFRNLHKACYNALQALARVTKDKGETGMQKDVEETLREDPERFRDMALALRTDRSRSRRLTSLQDVKEYIKTMAATRTISRNKKQLLLTKRQWVCWQRHNNGYGQAKALELWKAAKLDCKVHKEMNKDKQLVIAVDLPVELVDSAALERRQSLENRLDVVAGEGDAMLQRMKAKPLRLPSQEFLRKRCKLGLADLSDGSASDCGSDDESDMKTTLHLSPRARSSGDRTPASKSRKRHAVAGSDSDPPRRKTPSVAPSSVRKGSRGKGTPVKGKGGASTEDSDEEEDDDAAEDTAGKSDAIGKKSKSGVCEPYTGKMMPAAFIGWKKMYVKAMLLELGRYGREANAKNCPLRAGRVLFDKVSDDNDIKVLDFTQHERGLLVGIQRIKDYCEDANGWKQSHDLADLQKRGETLKTSFRAQRDRFEEVIGAMREVFDARRFDTAIDKRKCRNAVARKAKLWLEQGVPPVLARLWAEGPSAEESGASNTGFSLPCKFPEPSKMDSLVSLVQFLEKNREKADKKAASLKAKMTSSAGIIMLDFGEQDAPDVKADGLELAEHAGELLRRPILVGVCHHTWKWHVNAWPLAGVGAFVFGHSSSLLVTVVAIEQLREGGLEAMSGIGNFMKTLEIGSAVLGKGTHKTFVVGPGEALWIPTGYLPLVTGIKHGDEEDKKSVAAIFRFWKPLRPR